MKTTPIRTAGRTVLAMALSATLLLAACGDDDDDAADANETSTEQSSSSETTEAQAAVDDAGDSGVVDGVVTVHLVDYGFEGLPDSVPAGTKLEVVNDSTEEFHELVAFKLPEGETRSAEELVQLPEDELGALFAGPPAAVLLAGPNGGEQTAAVGDGTLSEPGQYVLFCSIPTGADPEELQAAAESGSEEPPPADPDAGPPHFVHGMYADLVVE